MFNTLKEDVSCVFERDPAARNVFEVLTTYPGLWAVMLHRGSHWLWTHRLKWLARFISTFGRWVTGIEVHPGAQIGRRFFIDHGMGVVIGETAEIGNDCTLYQGVTLGGTSWNKGKRHPTLEDNVVVGAGAKVLGPFTVRTGARIGANAVVVKEVPEDATVVGIPGHVVGAAKAGVRPCSEGKPQFDAYGTPKDLPDPVANAMNCMLEHIDFMDERIAQMTRAIHDMGGEVTQTAIPEIDPEEMRPLKDH